MQHRLPSRHTPCACAAEADRSSNEKKVQTEVSGRKRRLTLDCCVWVVVGNVGMLHRLPLHRTPRTVSHACAADSSSGEQAVQTRVSGRKAADPL